MRHPIHPMLVHFPIACWTLASACDAIGWAVPGAALTAVAGWLLVVGLGVGALAVAAGLYDFSKLADAPRVLAVAQWHMGFASAAWSCYAVSAYLRAAPGFDAWREPDAVAVALSAAGFVALVITGWLGGRLVYEFRVGSGAPRS